MKRVIAVLLLLAGIGLGAAALDNFGNYRSRRATADNAEDLRFADKAFYEALPFAVGGGVSIALGLVLLVASRKKKAA